MHKYSMLHIFILICNKFLFNYFSIKLDLLYFLSKIFIIWKIKVYKTILKLSKFTNLVNK